MAEKIRRFIYPMLQALLVIAILHGLGPAPAAEDRTGLSSRVMLTDAKGRYPLGARLSYLEGLWAMR